MKMSEEEGTKGIAVQQVIALYDYNPLKDELPTNCCHQKTAPDPSVQLPICRGDKFIVVTETMDWWLLCRSVKTKEEGYICSVLLAPLPNNVKDSKLSKKVRKMNGKFFPDDPKFHEQKQCPREKANIFSILTFWWLNSLIATGFKRPLIDDDIWKIEENNKARYINELVEKEWQKEMDKMKRSPLVVKKMKKKEKIEKVDEKDLLMATSSSGSSSESHEEIKVHSYQPSLTKVFLRVFGAYFFVGNIQKFIHDILLLAGPYMLKKLINFVENEDEDTKWGYIYSFELLGIVTLQSLILHQYFTHAFTTAMRVNTAVMTIVYKKMFKLNSHGRKNFTAGEMVNLMSVDAQKCHDLFVYLALIWSGPFQITVALVGLYFLMGWSILAGFGLLLLLIPVNLYLKNKEKAYHTKQMKHKDERSKLINEIIAGIRIIKMYAWENSFLSKVTDVRNKELLQMKKSRYLAANMSFTMSCTPFLVSIVTFVTYVYLAGNVLTAEKAFVSIALFNIIRFPLFIIPVIVNNIVQYKVSAKRLTAFLKAEEFDESDVERLPRDDQNDEASVKVENGTFKWEKDPVLNDINFEVGKGKLFAIVGQVGTGKSSLLSAILGEISKVNGRVTTQGSIAYVAQQPWIQNESLRENILFTKSYKSEKYEDIIKACALESDIQLLPNGDMTEIGEKGINLSGGQKQRVALARAIYNNADVYLFDDPLSAVDAHVGKHIFEKVIGPKGLLKNKTRILVTHNLSFLPDVDKIIVLKDKSISEAGSYTNLLAEGKDFAEYLKTYHQNRDGKADEQETKSEKKMSVMNSTEDIQVVPDVKFSERNHSLSNALMSASRYSLDDVIDGVLVDEDVINLLEEHQQLIEKNIEHNPGGLIAQEKSEVGKVNRKVFWHYFQSIGLLAAFITLVGAFCQEASLIGSRVWLAEWSSNTVNITDAKRDYYVGIYCAIGFGQSIFALLTAFALAIGTIYASRTVHKQLLDTILHCPMSFFETTPMGRIVNRFVKDINSLDEKIPQSTKSFLATFMTLLGTIFVISYTTPVFLAVLFPIALLYFFTQRVYVASSRQLKRIVAVHRSPIFNHYFESIFGVSTIRAFRKVDDFTYENYARIDEMQAAHFPTFNCDRWLAIRLELCGNLITFFAALFCIIGRGSLSPGIAGLSISYALQITQSLNWLVRMASELETNIISVERIKDYISKPREALPVIENHQPPPDWPCDGAITFEHYSVRYRPELDLVLKDLSLKINPREKIGIVGRTGAGKSSITLALLRIIESASGKILIDGLDVSTIGLRNLREKISIIPQDPVLFSGSIRFNVDPFMEHTDETLWNAMEVSHLKTFVSSLEKGLHHEVTEGGENLSVGQRQLICLARALLRKTKILVLDEATAAVDMETDAFIQQTIRDEFNQCTVLTIAHRLNTIVDYDRILLLHQGNVAEFDKPDVLLKDENSMFYKMAKDAGLLTQLKSGTLKET